MFKNECYLSVTCLRQFSAKAREIFPNSVVKRIKIVKNKTKSTNSASSPPKKTQNVSSRLNDANIQMLSSKLYEQLFKDANSKKLSANKLSQCLADLKKHNIDIKKINHLPDVEFTLPKLKGNTLEEHFYNIGEEQDKPYRDLIQSILSTGIPEKPNDWLFEPGWTRYEPGRPPESVHYPLEDCMVFDVEVCMNAGAGPILATAVTNKAWYCWISKFLTDLEDDSLPDIKNRYQYTLDDLIPLESQLGEVNSGNFSKPRVVIGHNVSFDRARVKEQYWIERTATRFVDTMSLHVCVSGITSYQRAVLKSGKVDEEDKKWLNCSSLNSLAEVCKLYCNRELDKETRDIFVKGTLFDVKQNFQMVTSYCANDVEVTFQVLQNLFPLFLERFPHPVTFAGMLELNTAYLPINSNWTKYVQSSENTFVSSENQTIDLLARKANEASELMKDAKYKEDLWMWDQDWSVRTLRGNKTAQEKLFASYPAWYRKLCSKPDLNDPDWVPVPNLISTSMRITPKLLRLTWEGYPLHYLKDQGWGFLVPFTTDLDTAENIPLKQLVEKCPVVNIDRDNTSTPNMLNLWKDVQENLARKEYYSRKKEDKTDGAYKGTGVWCNVILENCCFFMRLPHKDGVQNRVGNPLAKDFLTKFSENVLAGDDETTERVLEIGRMLTYWRNNRDRILKQMIVWFSRNELPDYLRRVDADLEFGAIIPQVVVCGTLTRRAVEPTWMTASNARHDRIGSELRAFVQAPPGFNIVGADVDSQELWIASVIGDSDAYQMNGATPFGWMTLSGNKANATDMHSVTAQAVGISRDQAKVINYARIYGAGQNFAERLLKQFNPSMTANEARSKAMKMFALTKGKRFCRIKEEHLDNFADKSYNIWEAMKIAKAHGKKLDEMFHKPKWIGGTESAMFNRLEEIAGSDNPVTPFLGCRLSRALEPENMPGERFLPTRVNWVVQSGAVDYLHLMLVSMRWLMGEKARFVLSFHDEVRYLVSEEHKYQAALAMHITNLLTRAFCVKKLGLNDLPMSVAFFTSVEVDKVLRKEATQDCVTPSNASGLEKGYGVPKGESLDVYETLKRCKGAFGL